MSFTGNIVINTYSIILLVFICIQVMKDTGKKQLQNRLYIILLKVTVLLLVFDIFSRFDGNPGTIFSVINHFGNFIVFLFNFLIASLWLLYSHYQVFQDEKSLKPLLCGLLAINAANAILVIMSQSYGWLYYIDTGNIYHRGPLFWLPVTMTAAAAILASAIVLLNRKRIERKHFYSILLFPLPPLICMVLQLIYYGSSLMLNGVAFSLLIIFITIQNRNMNIDYLTGAYNRKRLETYLQERINASSEHKTFSAILIDLDDFKRINDTHGHIIGDYVLECTVKMLRSCLGEQKFIARFGGDEFNIVLDISNKADLEAVVSSIISYTENYNMQGDNPFKLNFSIGYAVYDYRSHMSLADFQKQIDSLMYVNKRARKAKLTG